MRAVRNLSTRVLAVALLVGLVVVVSWARPSAPDQGGADDIVSATVVPGDAATGCGPAQAPKFGDNSFTPYGVRFGYAPRLTIGQRGQRVEEPGEYRLGEHSPLLLSSVPGDRRLRLAMAGSEGDLGLFFSAADVPLDATLEEFWAAGGIVLGQRAAAGHDGQSVLAEAGARAAEVMLGPHRAALVHADPVDADGTRTYNLYWSDGERDVSLIGNARPETLIEVARALYCG